MSVASSSSWTSFLKSIASFNGDLSSLTAPPFILSPYSLTEYSEYWAEHPDLLIAPNFVRLDSGMTSDESARSAMELKRMIAVTRWFISTLRSQYCSRNESMGTEKKPLNPFLGEVFVGKWEDKSPEQNLGETFLLSEQVSHHPPETGYAVVNKKNQVVLQGYNGIRTWFSTTTLNIKQYGHALLTYGELDETYLVTLPPLHIEGLISASPFVELDGTSYIQASNGLIAVIEYSGRGYFSGKKNTFKARIYKDQLSAQAKENALVSIAGQWSGKSYICKGYGSPLSKSDELFHDAQWKQAEGLKVKPIEEQHPLETRKAWKKVADAIKSSDYDLISKEKTLIENQQRELRKQERDNEITWLQRWFDPVDYTSLEGNVDDRFMSLADMANLSSGNVPSGTIKGSKYDLAPTSDAMKHWRVNLDKWEKETEIKL